MNEKLQKAKVTGDEETGICIEIPKNERACERFFEAYSRITKDRFTLNLHSISNDPEHNVYKVKLIGLRPMINVICEAINKQY